MKIYEYSAQTVRKTICGNEKAAKADAAEAVCQIYPELKNRLDQEKKSRKLYWFHLFDSTALGLCWLKKRGKISLPAKT
jgi:Holliday junction resolvasome RuvABC endonuclease subunit